MQSLQFCYRQKYRSRNGSVGIVTRLRAGCREFVVGFPVGKRDLYFLGAHTRYSVQQKSGVKRPFVPSGAEVRIEWS
jgi:hypothetical protein